jgi:hypothetical protein
MPQLTYEILLVTLIVATPLVVLFGFAMTFWIPPRKTSEEPPEGPSSD